MSGKVKIGIIVAIAVLLFSGMGKYNGFVENDEEITGQWAQVENEYQRRLDLIPNLVETVKGYADFEKSTLLAVTEARASAFKAMSNTDGGRNLGEFNKANSTLVGAMRGMLGYTEKYPDLKANENFMDLQKQLEGTENRITTERMRFNEQVEEYNKMVKKFPNSLIAGATGFKARDYFEAAEGSDTVPEVKF